MKGLQTSVDLFTQRFMCSTIAVIVHSVFDSFFVIIKCVLIHLNEKYLMHNSS
jgi:hypothetical protein